MTGLNIDQCIGWYTNHFEKLTYSMQGSRNGQDGTADCSGALTQALFEAGASPYEYLYSTRTLHTFLSENRFECLGNTPDLACQKGDVILLSWGNSLNHAEMGNGHCGILETSDLFISVDYSTHKGAVGKAVAHHPWKAYYKEKKPDYLEVWRLKKS